MSVAPLAYRWSASEFIRASDAGAFDSRVELVGGEVWPLVIGNWHGDIESQLKAILRHAGVRVTGATLPTGESLPDPDCWVRRADAEPVGLIGNRLQVWDPADVLLVVEVSDESMLADLEIKSRLYGKAGYAVYWVVTPDAIYEHTNPTSRGYHTRNDYVSGDLIPLRYAGIELSVAELLGLE